jgi:hypothetical protein
MPEVLPRLPDQKSLMRRTAGRPGIRPQRSFRAIRVISGGEDFLYVFKPGPQRPGRAAACSGYALAAASLRERAGRLARDTRLWLWRGCVRVREREARIVRSRPPSVKPANASRPVRPLRASIDRQ